LTLNIKPNEHKRTANYPIVDFELKHDVLVGSWQQWSKKLSDKSAAVLVMNNDDMQLSVTLDFSKIPTFAKMDTSTISFTVRDVWKHEDMGILKESMTFTLDSHDSAFVILTMV
jgi:hypothetical protein